MASFMIFLRRELFSRYELTKILTEISRTVIDRNKLLKHERCALARSTNKNVRDFRNGLFNASTERFSK